MHTFNLRYYESLCSLVIKTKLDVYSGQVVCHSVATVRLLCPKLILVLEKSVLEKLMHAGLHKYTKSNALI